MFIRYIRSLRLSEKAIMGFFLILYFVEIVYILTMAK